MREFLMTFSLQNIQIQVDEPVSVQISFGEDEIKLKQAAPGRVFNREFTICLLLTDEKVLELAQAPPVFRVLRGSEELGRFEAAAISSVFKDHVVETDFQDHSLSLRENILKVDSKEPVGFMTLFWAISLSEAQEAAEPVAQKTDESLSIEMSYYFVNGELLNVKDIAGPCGKRDCPSAVLAKQELERIIESKRCTCEHVKDDVAERMWAVHPFDRIGDAPDTLYVKAFTQELPLETQEGCAQAFESSSAVRQRAGAVRECERCPNCHKRLDYESSTSPCPLCEEEKPRSDCRRQTPLITTFSQDLANRLKPSSALQRRPRGCPCCLKAGKKCRDCVNRSSSSSSSSCNYTIRSESSRYSMYGSLPDQKTAQEGMRRSTRSSCPFKTPKRSRKSKGGASCEDEMTCAEKLACLKEQLKKQRLSRPKPLKSLNVKSRYSYRFGKRYPGIKIGHRECVMSRGFVPSHMGWLWNVPTLGINCSRVGWKPGAVTKPIKELMMHFLKNYPCDNLPNTRRPVPPPHDPCQDPCSEQPPCKKSAIQVRRGNGEYHVTFNPLKDAKNMRAGENPFMDCPPFKFRIVADESSRKLALCRAKLCDLGFQPCSCENPKCCACRSEKETCLLKKQMRKISKAMGLEREMVPEDFTKENTDKMDMYEFTPESAMIGNKPKRDKKDTRVSETQYDDKDFLGAGGQEGAPCKDPKTGKKGTMGKGGVCMVPGAACKDDSGKTGKVGKDGTCMVSGAECTLKSGKKGVVKGGKCVPGGKDGKKKKK